MSPTELSPELLKLLLPLGIITMVLISAWIIIDFIDRIIKS